MTDSVHILVLNYLYEENSYFVFTDKPSLMRFAYDEVNRMLDCYHEQVPFDFEDMEGVRDLDEVLSEYSDTRIELSTCQPLMGRGEIDVIKTRNIHGS